MNENMLYMLLSQLDKKQFKIFYSNLVHCLVHGYPFISDQNLLALWEEANELCYETDNDFPNPYTDHIGLKIFCQTHPYYFIDRLPLNMVAELFATYCDERLELLHCYLHTLIHQGTTAAHQYMIDTFGLDHNADELTTDLDAHINTFS